MVMCEACGNHFIPKRGKKNRFCSHKCMRSKNGGQNRKAETWWTNSKGYIEGRIWENGKQRRVKRHRYLAEKHMGRALLPSEDVHHVDENKAANDPGNLQPMDHGDHTRLHNLTRVYKRGYKLKLSDAERSRRSAWMSSIHKRRAALAKARGETP